MIGIGKGQVYKRITHIFHQITSNYLMQKRKKRRVNSGEEAGLKRGDRKRSKALDRAHFCDRECLRKNSLQCGKGKPVSVFSVGFYLKKEKDRKNSRSDVLLWLFYESAF